MNSEKYQETLKRYKENFEIHFDKFDDFLVYLMDDFLDSDLYDTNLKYEEQVDDLGCVFVHLKYIEYFLNNGLDPQIGLQKIIKGFIFEILGGNVYEIGEDFFKYIDIFISAGADISQITKYLFILDEINHIDVIHEYFGCITSIICPILDHYWKDLDRNYILSVCDWESVEAINFQEYDETENLEISQILYGNYKYFSEELKKINKK
jgi:hypothetical protein